MGQFITENWQWITAAAIPAAAPIVTTLVNKFGSVRVKKGWNAIRKIYRLGFMPKSTGK